MSKIIEHMQETGEWGEFFPPHLSPFCYNESVADEYFPLSRGEAESYGWKWQGASETAASSDMHPISASELPLRIEDAGDEWAGAVIECQESGRPFRIQKAELAYYRARGIALPHCHPDVRHHRRLMLRNPRRLWQRSCDKCGAAMMTSYAPERPETVYCERYFEQEMS